MKIGLLRHFKTAYRVQTFCNSEEYDSECLAYDRSGIIPPGEIIPTQDYAVCYTSKLKRARETAELVFKREIITTAALIEVPMKAAFTSRLKLPFGAWNVINRAAWAMNSTRMPETRQQTQRRAIDFLTGLMGTGDSRNTLIVTHGFFMLMLQNELLKMDFKGKEVIHPKHGELYEFKKAEMSK